MIVSKLQSHCYVSTDGNNLIVPLNEPRKTDLVPGKLSGTDRVPFREPRARAEIDHDFTTFYFVYHDVLEGPLGR